MFHERQIHLPENNDILLLQAPNNSKEAWVSPVDHPTVPGCQFRGLRSNGVLLTCGKVQSETSPFSMFSL